MTNTQRPTWYAPALAAVLYFSQGLPFGIVNELMPLYLRIQNVSLTQIGLLSTLSLAWTWKVLWSPLIDMYGSYRRWMAGALVVLAGSTAALAVVPPSQTALFWTIIGVIAFASATQDIAIDAMAIRITPERLLGYVNSVRVAAYRGAMIVAGGALAWLSASAGWPGAFWTVAAIMVAIFAFTFVLPPESGAAVARTNPFAGVAQWLRRPSAIAFVALALIYRLGDAALTPMIKPYWVDRGFSAGEIGTVTTVLGISLLIVGAAAGGLVISRYGIYRALLWLGILQMLSNVGYALVAQTVAGRTGMYTATIIENFTGGLGTAAFLAFLMAICDREFAATQFAMLSAAFALSRSVIGSFSGVLAENMGYAPYFWVTVALGIPGLLLLLVPSVARDLRGRVAPKTIPAD